MIMKRENIFYFLDIALLHEVPTDCGEKEE
jgi:hypothetical protein